MEYADQIFQPFKRLHAHTEIQGTGMGLPIVQKILARLGGRIDVNSVPGEGTVFTISLPERSQ
ncbi:MAG: ATP-binding protein [Minwuia sp.]|uniref:ATP-binding protein n=1 Tax=Minwuia sp. TaxID=2493630 RepID=UPI003A839870